MNTLTNYLLEDFSLGIQNWHIALIAIIPLAMITSFLIVYRKERRAL